MSSPYRSILCPIDLSPAAVRALEVAYALAGPDTVVHLLHVEDPSVVVSLLDGSILARTTSTEALAASERGARARIRTWIPDAAGPPRARTEIHVLHEPDIAEQIASEAKRLRADVVVMGTHGRTGFGRILMGSVAADTLRKCPVPVILVHDRDAGGSAPKG